MEAHSPAHAVRPPVLLACFYGLGSRQKPLHGPQHRLEQVA